MLAAHVNAGHGVGGGTDDLEAFLGEGGHQCLAEQLGVVDYQNSGQFAASVLAIHGGCERLPCLSIGS